MSDNCCADATGAGDALNDKRWRRILWIALILNAAMFFIEMGAGVQADSRALQADALDFFGDAANYAISLGVAGMALAWRSRAAMFKGITILLFGLFVMGSALWAFANGTAPVAETMGIVGTLALLVNVGVAFMLYRYRTGDANMRSVWLCSRNDAISNVAVIAAALGVAGTDSAWPDLGVAAIMAGLAITSGIQIIWQARDELKSGAEPSVSVGEA
ncbi:cation transporter [Altererythrobacter sp. RZ02]|uniref:Cation transporter n=1 Tax=Pontixanthobacter rizhaonensis TaxID=2730337 RepID=A0A848QKM1_9SPHN|nr:cation transporter [Pontixanthobacter rizhaonensis]NMW31243.1 cation transporter [Pontixanthobacter rizhaonensis]